MTSTRTDREDQPMNVVYMIVGAIFWFTVIRFAFRVVRAWFGN